MHSFTRRSRPYKKQGIFFFFLRRLPILPEVVSELDNVKQELSLLHGTPEEALAEAQRRLEKKWAMFQDKQRARYANGSVAD